MRAIGFLLILALGCVSGQTVPNFQSGRTVIVHLFEWSWAAIADECERFLGPYGFAGVQVSPPGEHVTIWDPWRPWWESYQPTSYKLNSRRGDENAFRDMVTRCRNVDVLIYADAVINHMMAGNYDYPDVPYSPNDFNVPRGKCNTADGGIHNYGDVNEVRNCNLVGLNDILFGNDVNYYTNGKVADFLNSMIDVGVAGFRVDATKHMWPGDLEDIYGRLHNTFDGSRPYIYQEVIDHGGEAISGYEYTDLGDVTEFKYCDEIIGLGKGTNPAKYYHNFGEAWGMMYSYCSLVFVDNHDNQRDGHALTYKDPWPYKKALAYGMAWDYGVFRMMSSYYFDTRDDSPPAYEDGSIKDPTINPDSTCNNGWVCEHRWRQLRNMACFRNSAGFEPVQNWYDNGDNFIAFSRGNKAFFALNQQSYTFNVDLYTGLASGVYCDVITGDPTGSGCTGKTIYVDDYGWANFDIPNGEDSMIAIHVGSQSYLSGNQCHWW